MTARHMTNITLTQWHRQGGRRRRRNGDGRIRVNLTQCGATCYDSRNIVSFAPSPLAPTSHATHTTVEHWGELTGVAPATQTSSQNPPPVCPANLRGQRVFQRAGSNNVHDFVPERVSCHATKSWKARKTEQCAHT